ncbi:hypothetical protein SADUNF_Sadunf15G0084200 [Salix dunnii]|uniref:Uncharacterized protein n=1 Tax=Salix dunnii TaxID=1413687 RepID=A0A835MLA0_9ROSI|nr:hypothetical protein SADUNF_Sadunf15G0084200 [Salix dunnii]
MEEGDHKELQLLPSQLSIASSSSSSSLLDSSLRYRSVVSDHNNNHNQFGGPSLDLQLSISVRPIQAPSSCVLTGPICDFSDVKTDTSCVEALKWQAAEQIKLAAIEKAYAERVRDLTRKEMELAQSEFAKARHIMKLNLCFTSGALHKGMPMIEANIFGVETNKKSVHSLSVVSNRTSSTALNSSEERPLNYPISKQKTWLSLRISSTMSSEITSPPSVSLVLSSPFHNFAPSNPQLEQHITAISSKESTGVDHLKGITNH